MASAFHKLYRPFPAKAIKEYERLLPRLIEVARSDAKAELVIRNANFVDVVLGEIVEGVSVAIYKGFIVGIVNSKKDSVYVGPQTLVIDSSNMFLTPGFIDAHVHIESSMLNIENFVNVAIRHGVTTVVADPHEVANVGGAKHLYSFASRASKQLLKVLVQLPPCVPPTSPDVDSPGSTVSSEAIVKLFSTELFYSLGEFMDFPAVIRGSPEALSKISCAYERSAIIYGHIPSADPLALNAYAVTPISSCHESVSIAEVVEKLRRGMWVMLRFGTAWRDAEALLPSIAKSLRALHRVMLVTDDISAVDLVEKGYLDYAVKKLIELGLDPIETLRLITINPATYIGLDRLIGIVAPGRLADIVLLKSLEGMDVSTVIVEGNVVYHKGELINHIVEPADEEPLQSPFTIPRTVNEQDLLIRTGSGFREADVIVAEIIPNTPRTAKKVATLPILDGVVRACNSVLHVAVVDRYQGMYIGKGFASNLSIHDGAVAQTIAHDTHNVIVVGGSARDMLKAIKELERIGGGIVVVEQGKVVCIVELREAGLMSVKSVEQVYTELKCVEKFFEKQGASDPLKQVMYISLLTLPVIPEVRITPKGVVDVLSQRVVNPVVALR
jgi:adenine deaminase